MDMLTMMAGIFAMNAMDEAEARESELERLREENARLRDELRTGAECLTPRANCRPAGDMGRGGIW